MYDRKDLIGILQRQAPYLLTISYGQLARQLGDHEAGAIRRLTSALELLMEEDHQNQRPFLAALVCQRHSPLPARGFFEKARALGYLIEDEASFHQHQLTQLAKLAAK